MMGTAAALRQHRKILLVEDDGDLRDALSDALERNGHEVVAVDDGKEALRQMRAIHPDIVLLDLMMPGMNGWQFRIEQKNDPSLAETPVVVMSANQSETAAAVDADVYLEKPFSTVTVLDAIDDVMRTQERRMEPARVAQAERMASLGTLAAGVAHEINNPLTYVLLHLSSLAQQLRGLATAENREKVEHLVTVAQGALEGAERIREITNGIRAMSRMEEGAKELVDVRLALDNSIKMISNELRHRAQLVTDYREVPYVLGNEGRFGQVFLNLLTNAMQAIPEGDADAHVVKVVTRTDELGNAVIEVSDTGMGIAPHQMGHLFEPFFTSKPPGQGTGLGLSISHGIVRSAGGEIDVRSEPGKGSTFTVSLPPVTAARARASSESETSAAAANDEVNAQRRRVLVIDDEVQIGRGIAAALEDEHDVTVAPGGRRGLDMLLGGGCYDVVLCDLHMPDLSGMELYARLRQIRPKLAQKIVFMTAGAFTDKARQTLATANRPSIEKPVDLATLRELLASWKD